MAESNVPSMFRHLLFDVDVGPHWLAGELSDTPATAWSVSDWRREAESQVFELRGPDMRTVEVELRDGTFRVVSDSARRGVGEGAD